MKIQLFLTIFVLLGVAGCSADDSSSGVANNIPEGGHWQVTVDGADTYESTTLSKNYLSGELLLMGSAFSQGGKGVILQIPMATEGATGSFESGVELELIAVPNVGQCEHEAGSTTSKVIVNITHNSRELLVSEFEFTKLGCKKSGTDISGRGVITKKRKVKN